jgi:hypothetical protein
METQIPASQLKVRLEDEPLKVKDPPKTGVLAASADLEKKITEKMESEVDEALGDVGRRKEYREALAKAGITMDWMVEKLKNVAVDGEKDADKIKALQVLLKSLGVDKTGGKDEETMGTWEDALMNEENKEPPSLDDYEVKQPKVPESAKKKSAEDKKVSGSIYE